MIEFVEEDYPGCKYRYRVRKPQTFKERCAARERLDKSNIDYISGGGNNTGIYTFTNEKDAFWFCIGG